MGNSDEGSVSVRPGQRVFDLLTDAVPFIILKRKEDGNIEFINKRIIARIIPDDEVRMRRDHGGMSQSQVDEIKAY
jgi:hypothetical protein